MRTRRDLADDAVSLLTDRGYSMPPWDGTGELRTEWRGQGEKYRDRNPEVAASIEA